MPPSELERFGVVDLVREELTPAGQSRQGYHNPSRRAPSDPNECTQYLRKDARYAGRQRTLARDSIALER